MLISPSLIKFWILIIGLFCVRFSLNVLNLMELANKTYLDVDFPVDRNGELIILPKYSPLRLS